MAIIQVQGPARSGPYNIHTVKKMQAVGSPNYAAIYKISPRKDPGQSYLVFTEFLQIQAATGKHNDESGQGRATMVVMDGISNEQEVNRVAEYLMGDTSPDKRNPFLHTYIRMRTDAKGIWAQHLEKAKANWLGNGHIESSIASGPLSNLTVARSRVSLQPRAGRETIQLTPELLAKEAQRWNDLSTGLWGLLHTVKLTEQSSIPPLQEFYREQAQQYWTQARLWRHTPINVEILSS